MKNIFILLLLGISGLWTSCSEDLGNYDYTSPEIPVVTDLDSIYPVFVGDQLNITPNISFSDTSLLSYEWKIAVPEEIRSIYSYDKTLKIFFGLGAQDYKARFSVINKSNGMKYFYYCTLRGQTDFSQGITLLTSHQGQAEISFIKPNGKVQSDIYGQMYGKPLPGSPRQLLAIQHEYMQNKPYLGYWVICDDTEKGGVQLDVNTFKRIKFLNENFFTIPDEPIDAQYFFPTPMATMNGIINHKFYLGASSTYYMSPIYGYFGVPAMGDYELSPHFIHRETYYLGFDSHRSTLLYFDGGGNYYGDNYNVQGSYFDPKQLGLEVIAMQSVSPEVNYLIGKKTGDPQIYELKFSVTTDSRTITPLYKRIFSGQSHVRDNSLWVLSNTEIFYFSSQDKIYRFNPLNQEMKLLSTDFKGKTVTLLKLKNANTLIAGTEGMLYFLDISTGKSGEVLREIPGITGEPIDLYEKE